MQAGCAGPSSAAVHNSPASEPRLSGTGCQPRPSTGTAVLPATDRADRALKSRRSHKAAFASARRPVPTPACAVPRAVLAWHHRPCRAGLSHSGLPRSYDMIEAAGQDGQRWLSTSRPTASSPSRPACSAATDWHFQSVTEKLRLVAPLETRHEGGARRQCPSKRGLPGRRAHATAATRVFGFKAGQQPALYLLGRASHIRPVAGRRDGAFGARQLCICALLVRE